MLHFPYFRQVDVGTFFAREKYMIHFDFCLRYDSVFVANCRLKKFQLFCRPFLELLPLFLQVFVGYEPNGCAWSFDYQLLICVNSLDMSDHLDLGLFCSENLPIRFTVVANVMPSFVVTYEHYFVVFHYLKWALGARCILKFGDL